MIKPYQTKLINSPFAFLFVLGCVALSDSEGSQRPSQRPSPALHPQRGASVAPLRESRRCVKSLINCNILMLAVLLQACVQIKLDAPALPTARKIGTITTEEPISAFATPSAQFVIPVLTATEIFTKPTSLPKVTLSAIKGNLFIRRGPDMAFNPIGVLYKNTSAPIIASDVLTKWVQIIIPNSDKTGWVSIQTAYSRVDGDLNALPDFTTPIWPSPAYLRNCTHHQMYILPNEIVLPSSFGYPENEIWLYPGSYTVYDLDVPGQPEVMQVDIREGLTEDIHENGLGEHRKSP